MPFARHRRASLGLLVALGLACGGAMGGPAEAGVEGCRSHFRAGRYLRAARCFRKAARELRGAGLSLQQRYRKGRLLRNAVAAYHKAAKASRHRARRAYYYHQAVGLLALYLRQDLAESAYRKQSARQLKKSYSQRIGWARLKIDAGHPDAKISVRGFRSFRKGTHRLSLRLRPGAYRVQVQYPGQLQPLRKGLQLRPKQRRKMVWVAPKSQLPNPLDQMRPSPPRPAPKRKPAPRGRAISTKGEPGPRNALGAPDPLGGMGHAAPRRSPPPGRTRRPTPPRSRGPEPRRSRRLSRAPMPRSPRAQGGAKSAGIGLWIALIGGGLLAGVGGVLLSQAYAKDAENGRTYANLKRWQSSLRLEQSQQLAQGIHQAQLFHGLGWGFAIGGGAAVLVGAIGLWLTPPPQATAGGPPP